MLPAKIEVGRTYCNRGKGRTRRTVVSISEYSPDNKPPWYSMNKRPDDLVVRYSQDGKESLIYLQSFASWCGRDVTDLT